MLKKSCYELLIIKKVVKFKTVKQYNKKISILYINCQDNINHLQTYKELLYFDTCTLKSTLSKTF